MDFPAGRRKVASTWRWARFFFGGFLVMADWPSRLRLARMKLPGDAGLGDAPLPLRVKPLAGGEFWVRPGTSDVGTIFHDLINHEHLPPPGAPEDPRQIWELGSNIGTGVAGLAARYPRARLLGVEPDPANAALARRNLTQFGDRCRLLEVAIWDREADLVVEGERPSGFSVRSAVEADPPDRRVRATTIETLVEAHAGDDPIDYLILNLEGTEPRILTGDQPWARRVRSIRVELHPHYGFSAADCVSLLGGLGFRAWTEPEWWGGWGFGVRD
jgi:FkbM family methyltransferase